MRCRLLTTALTLALASPWTAADLRAQTPSRPPDSPAPGGAVIRPAVPRRIENRKGERNIVCRGAPLPAGWIVVDDMRDKTMCGGENPSVLNSYNVWAIERIDNRPTGATVDMCASTPTPEGWVLVDLFRVKEMCGHPSQQFTVNVKRIRRAR